MSEKKLLQILLLFCVFCLNACKVWFAKEFMAGRLSQGAASLLVQPATLIINELNKKEVRAGFYGPHAKVIVAQDESNHGKGTVIWKISNQDIFYSDQSVYKNCVNEEAHWTGHVQIIEATRSMYGRLTNDGQDYVIPDPNSLKFHVKAEAKNLKIWFVNKGSYLEIFAGDLEFDLTPRLAQSQKEPTKGMRVAKTSNTRVENFRVKNIRGRLVTPDITIDDLDIEHSDLTIQVGEGENGDSNMIKGTIRMLGQTWTLPIKGYEGLDPEYDPDQFQGTYDCDPELNGVVRYDHIPMEHKLAQAVSGLSAKSLGMILGLFEDNFECGFSAPDVIRNSTIPGRAGERSKAITEFNSQDGCKLKFLELESEPDCFGKGYQLSGKVNVKHAKKVMKGRVVVPQEDLNGSVDFYVSQLNSLGRTRRVIEENKPPLVLPSTSMPIEMQIEVEIEKEIALKETCSDRGSKSHQRHCKNNSAFTPMTLVLESGSFIFEAKPKLYKRVDREHKLNGSCTVKTPISKAKVSMKNVKARLEVGGKIIRLPAEGAFELVSGKIDDQENQLAGAVRVADLEVKFDEGGLGYKKLDPGYSPETFNESFMSCESTIAVPQSDSDCEPEEMMASNVARLLVMNAGGLLKLANVKSFPGGFANMASLAGAELLDNGTRLEMNGKLDSPFVFKENSNSTLSDETGAQLHFRGKLKSYQVKMERFGKRISENRIASNPMIAGVVSAIRNQNEFSVRPDQPNATNLKASASFGKFALRLDQKPYLVFDFAEEVSVHATPYMGRDKTIDEDSYSIATPVVAFNNIILTNARVQLVTGFMKIPMVIESAKISAFNGRYRGQGNYLDGLIRFAIAPREQNNPPMKEIRMENQLLVPPFPEPYNQEKFDNSYRFTKNLAEVLPAEKD